MKTLELINRDISNNTQSLTVKLNGKEIGVLFMTNDEYYDFIKILRKGIDSEFELIEPEIYSDDTDDDF